MSRKPKHEDEILIPSEHEDGHWCNAIVNHVGPDGMLVAATGHRYSNLVLVPPGYPWCWPADVGKVGTGSKPALLDEVQG